MTLTEFTWTANTVGLFAMIAAAACGHQYRQTSYPAWLLGVALGLFVGMVGAVILGVGLYMGLLADNVLQGIGGALEGLTAP